MHSKGLKESTRCYLCTCTHQISQMCLSSCRNSLCDSPVAAFINENFVVWGGSIRRTEGLKMSNRLNASRFPFCAIVVNWAGHGTVLLQQGPKSPEDMLANLQTVVGDWGLLLLSAQIKAEGRRSREEQDAANRAAFEADRARKCKRREEQERLERAAREAARRQEKAMSLGIEPEKGPDVTQVFVRLTTGERKERRFHSSTTISTIYDYVDSLDCLKAEKYSLVSNFPRVVYGPEKHSLTLKEAKLHPYAGFFVELE